MKTDTLTGKDFGISEALTVLGISEINNGACTGANWVDTKGEIIESYSPADGNLIGKIRQATSEDYEMIIRKSQEAFLTWRMIPAPKRGEIVRQIGDELRKFKEPLGKLVSYEIGRAHV